jgi:hypothetical protein
VSEPAPDGRPRLPSFGAPCPPATGANVDEASLVREVFGAGEFG